MDLHVRVDLPLYTSTYRPSTCREVHFIMRYIMCNLTDLRKAWWLHVDLDLDLDLGGVQVVF